MIKITPADSAFSKCVRARVNWTCERCGAVHERNSTGLHCSHFHGRGNWSLRFEPLNAFAHCYGCHSYLGANPTEFASWVQSKIGLHAMYSLNYAREDTNLGRQYRKTKGTGEIAKYFRGVYQDMLNKRDNGETGRIDFAGWL